LVVLNLCYFHLRIFRKQCHENFIVATVWTYREDRERVAELYSGKQVGRKMINTVPHDLGDPEEEPWIKVSICPSLKVVF
jgi:hypothetical protein